MTPGFWTGRRVLVTGHTGFKGAWLCWWLTSLGAEVSGFALQPPTNPSLFESSGLAKEMNSQIGDVRDASALEGAFRARRPEVVFHLAAQSLVRESYRTPAETVATNLMGTVHCLEAARRQPSVRAVLVVTSDKCYRNTGMSRGYTEDDPLGGEDPYAASKACAEIATHAWRTSFFGAGQGLARVASARAGNVVGGGDWAVDRLVPDAMRAFTAGAVLRVRNPAATRPWQHVLEPLRGYLMLAERLHSGDETVATGWNLGPDAADVRPVSWIADELADRWGGGARWEVQGGVHPGEAAMLALDSTQAHARLGWRLRIGLSLALDWVVEWHRAIAAGRGMREATLDQIERYEALQSA